MRLLQNHEFSAVSGGTLSDTLSDGLHSSVAFDAPAFGSGFNLGMNMVCSGAGMVSGLILGLPVAFVYSGASLMIRGIGTGLGALYNIASYPFQSEPAPDAV